MSVEIPDNATNIEEFGFADNYPLLSVSISAETAFDPFYSQIMQKLPSEKSWQSLIPKQIRHDPRSQTLFAEDGFNAASIDKLEISIKDWDLEEKITVDSAEYLGNARWEYRNSHIEGMRVTGGGFEFLAISDDLKAAPSRQFKNFSQAATWIDSVYAGADIAQISA